MFRLRYQDFIANPSYVAIADPVSFGHLSMETFLEVYGPLLQTLDGRDMSSYVDFYLAPSPCNNSILEFVDEDAKLDFLDLAVDLKLVPQLEVICRGCESKTGPAVKHIQPKVIKTDPKAKKLLCAQITVDSLSKKLLACTHPAEKEKIQSKLERATRILIQLKHSM